MSYGSPTRPTPELVEEIEGEVVWVAVGRYGKDATFHTTANDDSPADAEVDRESPGDVCHKLSSADDIVPRSRKETEKRGFGLCSACDLAARKDNGEDVDDPRKRDREKKTCKKCGGDYKILADHVPKCEGYGNGGATEAEDSEPAPPCPVCGRTDFKSERGMKSHCTRVHSETELEAASEYACPECDREFDTQNALNAHRGTAHSDPGPVGPCPECDLGRDAFETERGRRYHLSVVHDIRIDDLPADERVECPACGRDDFGSERAMRLHHSKSHGYRVDENEAQCKRCGGWFTPTPGNPNIYCTTLCQDNAATDRPRRPDGSFLPGSASESEVESDSLPESGTALTGGGDA